MAKTAINGFLLKIEILNLKGNSQEREPWSRRATPAIAALLALLQKLSR